MDQSSYIDKLLERFEMTNCFTVKTPCESCVVEDNEDSQFLNDPSLFREIVGSLIYIMCGTRPELSFVVTYLSQFMSKPKVCHLNAAKRVLKYLKGTKEKKIVFSKIKMSEIALKGFSDSDWGSGHDRKSVSGYCFTLQENGPIISWKSKKQSIVALSTCEAEYVALTYAIQES